MVFEKKKIISVHVLSLKSSIQNGRERKLPDNRLVVNFVNPKQRLVDFNQIVILKGQEMGRVNYIKSKDISNIIELTRPHLFKRYTLPGIHYLVLETSDVGLNIKVN